MPPFLSFVRGFESYSNNFIETPTFTRKIPFYNHLPLVAIFRYFSQKLTDQLTKMSKYRKCQKHPWLTAIFDLHAMELARSCFTQLKGLSNGDQGGVRFHVSRKEDLYFTPTKLNYERVIQNM